MPTTFSVSAGCRILSPFRLSCLPISNMTALSCFLPQSLGRCYRSLWCSRSQAYGAEPPVRSIDNSLHPPTAIFSRCSIPTPVFRLHSSRECGGNCSCPQRCGWQRYPPSLQRDRFGVWTLKDSWAPGGGVPRGSAPPADLKRDTAEIFAPNEPLCLRDRADVLPLDTLHLIPDSAKQRRKRDKGETYRDKGETFLSGSPCAHL